MPVALATPHRIKKNHRRRQRIASGSLDYNYFRDYEPGTGRYVEFDPLGQKAGPNGYGYVGANPLKSVDPAGLLQFSPNCTQQQRDSVNIALMDMFIDMLKKCNSGGGDCGGGCPDCKNLSKVFNYYLTTAVIQCNWGRPCATVNAKGNGMIWLYPPMLEPGAPQPCGCLKGTMFHEAMHYIHPDALEPEVDQRTKSCFSCAVSDGG